MTAVPDLRKPLRGSRRLLTGVVVTLALFAGALPASAVTTPDGGEAKGWQFEFTPYLFASGLNGKAGVNRVVADIDLSFGDILENLDSGFMSAFEVRKGAWNVVLDGVYFKLKDEEASSWQGPLGSTSTGTVEATITQQVYALKAGYRLADESFKVDLIGGARATLLDTDIDLTFTTGAPLLPDGSRSVSGSESWVDPVVGVRMLVPLAAKWTAVGYGDIGGFGLGSDLTYELLAGVNWQFAESVVAKLGYRYLYQDYEDDGFVWDMAASGFYLGAGFRF